MHTIQHHLPAAPPPMLTADRRVFLVSAVWAIMGAVITLVWLPDTTGLDLEEYDRMQVGSYSALNWFVNPKNPKTP